MDLEDRYPWHDNPEMKYTLEYAGFRYAHLVEMVDISDDVSPSILEADALRFAHFRKMTASPDGEDLLAWDYDDAASFVHQVTGMDIQICLRWMKHDWRP